MSSSLALAGMLLLAAIGPHGLEEVTPWSTSGGVAAGRFGQSVSASDLNGDGFQEVVVGEPGPTPASPGRVVIFRGGLEPPPGPVVIHGDDGENLGRVLLAAGDRDGDGFQDLALVTNDGLFILFGQQVLTRLPEDERVRLSTGRPVFLAAGDIDADGFSDLIVATTQEVGYLPGSAERQGDERPPVIRAAQHETIAGVASGDVDGDGFDDVIVAIQKEDRRISLRVHPGRARGLASAPRWTLELPATSAAGFPSALALIATDLTRDGHADLILGDPFCEASLPDSGCVMIHTGGAGGLSSQARMILKGSQAGARFGESLASTDINGDGTNDLIVGAPGQDTGAVNNGRIFLYISRADAGVPVLTLFDEVNGQGDFVRLGASLSVARDIDGDHLGDVLAGAPYGEHDGSGRGSVTLVHGRGGPAREAGWLADSDQTEALLGTSVAGVGDIDDDGSDDIVIGASFYDGSFEDEGRVYLYRGGLRPPRLPLLTLDGGQKEASLGVSVSAAGDVNGDGHLDLIVGAPLFDGEFVNEGRALIYPGTGRGVGSAPLWSMTGGQDYARYGISVAGAGDVDGDGYDDILVGASGYDASGEDSGAVLFYRGGPSGPAATPLRLTGGHPGARYGAAVAGAGDVNHDGYSDVIIGSPAFRTSTGRLYLYLGSAQGLSTQPDWTTDGSHPRALLGASVGSAGDVNADGFDDVIAGAPGYARPETKEGRAVVYLGNGGPMSSEPAWSVESNQTGAFFGISVSSAGDVDGDGYDDILVGARFFHDEYEEEGAAFLFRGSALGPSTLASWSGRGGRPGTLYGAAVATAGDFNGDGFSDILIGARRHTGPFGEGRVYVYYGSGPGR